MLTALLRMPLTTRWLRVSPRSSNGLIGFRFEVYGCSSEKQLFSFEGKTNIDAFNKGSRHGKNTSPLEFLFKFLRSRRLILVCFETLSQNLPISKTSRTRKKYVLRSRSLGFTIRCPSMRNLRVQFQTFSQ